jgi:uncharacterized protein
VRFLVVSFACGLLFAVGLGIGGMTQPAKAFAFLDVTGAWDPSLAFVMAGAIGVHLVAYRLILRRPSPLLAPSFSVPAKRGIDAPLLAGAAIFGAGWGLGGVCPGPGITAAIGGAAPMLVFVAAMLGGMALHQVVEAIRAPAPGGAADPAPGAEG